jgi:LuxR family transcriptional regulator, maltose regulon positive regulatory protein
MKATLRRAMRERITPKCNTRWDLCGPYRGVGITCRNYDKRVAPDLRGGDVVGSRASRGDRLPGERAELLATKVAIPRVRAGSLVRARLLAALDEALGRDLTLVCTPAGFGKTTLLAHWARAAPGRVAWLSLDEGDGDPTRFWRYVAAALERAGVGLWERIALLVDGEAMSSDDLVIAVVNELEVLPDDVVLVLDDYHTVTSPAVHETVAFVLDHFPGPLRLVIASRSDPPLPLARLRVTNRVAELRAAELRFTRDESAGLLRDVWGLHLAPEAVAVLEARTEGWAVGLQLAALSLRAHPDPASFLDAFSGSHRYVLDYLSEEVFEHLSEPERTFLLQTSILERLTGSLCDAVTGGTDGQHRLEQLERANLFLVPLDEQRRWYRFHHLFRDLLHARLARSERAMVPELHRRAAAWFDRHGLVDEAIGSALAAGDSEWAARLVEQHMGEALRREEGVILSRWLSALPEDVVRTRPNLCLAQGWMQLHIGHLDVAERLADQAERALAGGDGASQGLELPSIGGMVTEAPAAIGLLRADLAAARGDLDGMARSAGSALAQMAPNEHAARHFARFQLVCVDWMAGRLAQAEVGLAGLLEEGRKHPIRILWKPPASRSAKCRPGLASWAPPFAPTGRPSHAPPRVGASRPFTPRRRTSGSPRSYTSETSSTTPCGTPPRGSTCAGTRWSSCCRPLAG